jgi:uncharacterized membrane protein YhaH (DUF805 family)
VGAAYIWNEVSVSTCGGLIHGGGGLIFGGLYSEVYGGFNVSVCIRRFTDVLRSQFVELIATIKVLNRL